MSSSEIQRIAQLVDECDALRAENEQLKLERDNVNGMAAELQESCTNMQVELSALRAELKTAQDKLLPGGSYATQWECDRLQAENERWIKAFGEVDAKLHHVKQELAEVRAKAQTDISTLRVALEKCQLHITETGA